MVSQSVLRSLVSMLPAMSGATRVWNREYTAQSTHFISAIARLRAVSRLAPQSGSAYSLPPRAASASESEGKKNPVQIGSVFGVEPSLRDKLSPALENVLVELVNAIRLAASNRPGRDEIPINLSTSRRHVARL